MNNEDKILGILEQVASRQEKTDVILERMAARQDEMAARQDEMAVWQGKTDAVLERMAARQDEMAARQDEMAVWQGKTDAILERMSARQDEMAARQDEMASNVRRVEQNVACIENEHGRMLRVIYDGYLASLERDEAVKSRVAQLESTVERHDLEIRMLRRAK